MKHFILFLAAVFLILFLAVLNRTENVGGEGVPVVRVFGYSSFTAAWGPGPRLKELFEKECGCRVEFIEGSDSGILLQRLKIEGASLGADLVIGFDQFDLQKALASQAWQKINFSSLDLEPEIKSQIRNDYFVPYDWGLLGFMVRRSEAANPPRSLDDLLKPEWRRRIALQDPRTSSPGLLFLHWVLQSKGEDEGFKFLGKIMDQAHSFSPSWSTSIGLFNKKQVSSVFTYFTSPLYYQIEEKNADHETIEFNEPHPVQIEFMGIPEFCRHCDLAEKFVNLMLSKDGQKILMEKNYMFPVLRGVTDGTPFATLKRPDRVLHFEVPSEADVERWMKRWADLRRGGGM